MDAELLEKLSEKTGGRFRLAALMQKRVRELLFGSPKLVETDTHDLFEIALLEIESGRLKLQLPDSAADKGKQANE